MLLGSRVVRGPDWKWNDHEDDDEGLVGTIISVKEYEEGRPLHRRTVKVRWDNGYESNYTVGADGNHDLRVVEFSSNAAVECLEDFANVEKRPWENVVEDALETFLAVKSDSGNAQEKPVKTDLQKLAEKLVEQNQKAVFQTENSIPVEEPLKVEGLPPEPGSIRTGSQAADRQYGQRMSVRNRTHLDQWKDDPDSIDVYRMKSNPRGLMIIINIRKFVVDPSLPDHEKLQKDLVERTGSERDVYELSSLFGGYLQFEVHTLETEKTRYQLLEELRGIANKPKYKDYDCFALCIMSHGKGSEFYNYDGRTIKTSAIFNMFSNSQCENYSGKPKLFFIQACRGELGHGRPPAVVDGPTEERSGESYNNDMADMLLAYSSFEDYASFRHPEEGTLFIQSLVSVFEEYADKEDILHMMTKVNNRVHSLIHGSCGGRTQVPAPIPTLRKKLYFWPRKNFDEESR